METARLLELSSKHIAQTYTRFPVVIVKGSGTRVWDSDGKEFLDFVMGLAVNNLGHCHPRVVEAIRRQAGELIHVSNLYHIKPQIELAKLLADCSFADRSFFCNSGAEANEAAIKLARKYSCDKFGPGRHEIISMTQSFHGRTMASLSATGQEKFHKGFDPLLGGFRYLPFGDLDAVKAAVNSNTCAIMVEPLQGEGGVNVPPRGFLQGLRSLCDQKELLLIFDEVQTGFGRTGRLFAYEHYGVSADIMTLAKSLAGGVAIGAMLAKDNVAAAFNPGSHASTFGGNPLACAAGVAAVETILREKLSERAAVMGEYFFSALGELRSRYPFIKELRGKGLLIGMELEFEGKDIVDQCLQRGFLINCTMGKVLRFLPALIVEKREIDLLVETLDDLFKKAGR